MKLLALDLAGMLAFGGLIDYAAIDDAVGFDEGRTMEKIGYLTDLINAHVAQTESPAEPTELREAAQAVVDIWDSPEWVLAPMDIDRLRAALSNEAERVGRGTGAADEGTGSGSAP